eukprot:NP_497132.2 Uncharacterized protein CELE_W05G11.2 [Caenorhabditis elegans]
MAGGEKYRRWRQHCFAKNERWKISDAVREYNFQKEAFHLAVSLVDLALPMFIIDKMRFQLVGITSMMITKIRGNLPTNRVPDFLLMEQLIGKFEFVVAKPTPSWLGACFAKRINLTKKMRNDVKLLELSPIDAYFLRYSPSDAAQNHRINNSTKWLLMMDPRNRESRRSEILNNIYVFFPFFQIYFFIFHVQ